MALARFLQVSDLHLGRPFALFLVDMDGLKEVNDRLGHAAGSDALRDLAEALAGAVRTDDTVARIGGDEFAVLATVSGDPGASILGGRLKDALLARSLSASVGWATYPHDAERPDALFAAADAGLYAAKRRLVRSLAGLRV